MSKPPRKANLNQRDIVSLHNPTAKDTPTRFKIQQSTRSVAASVTAVESEKGVSHGYTWILLDVSLLCEVFVYPKHRHLH